MKSRLLLRSILSLAGGAFLLCAQAPAAEDAPPKLAIPIDQPSATVDAARKAMEATLHAIQPSSAGAPKSFVTPDGHYVLHGDLLHTGEPYALLEISIPAEKSNDYSSDLVALARWQKSAWELRGLWDIPSTWRPKGWKRDDNNPDDYLPIAPAEQPFFLEDLSGDGVPEVIVAGVVDKYFQEHYLLRFDPKAHSLKFVAEAMGMPEKAGDYVRLYYNSGRRAIYEEWQFLKWNNGDLEEVASWHGETPYNDPESPFTIVEGMRDGKLLEYRLEENLDSSVWTITTEGQPPITVRFIWPKGSPTDGGYAEDAWFFQKLTDLPLALFPDRSDVPADHLVFPGQVEVKGSGAVADLLRAAPAAPESPAPPSAKAR